MINLSGSEKQIAWAETIRTAIADCLDFIKKHAEKQYKVVGFMDWFLDNCDSAADIINFRDATKVTTGTYRDMVNYFTKTASKPELKKYVDQYFGNN